MPSSDLRQAAAPTSHLPVREALDLVEPERRLTVLLNRRRAAYCRLVEDQIPGVGAYYWIPLPPRAPRATKPTWLVASFLCDDWHGMRRRELWPYVLFEVAKRWCVPPLDNDYGDIYRALPGGRVGVMHDGRSRPAIFAAMMPPGRSPRTIKRAFNLPDHTQLVLDPGAHVDLEAQELLLDDLVRGRRARLAGRSPRR